ncbi:hypothetical protein BGZ96_009291, partial [Linnemannia gamsii]
AYQSLVENDPTLNALHHQALCMDAYRNNITPQEVQIVHEDEHEVFSNSESENHLTVILLFGGHVSEVGSYDSAGPLHLGSSKEDWTMIAMTRLKMWHGTTTQTGVPVNFQAILNSP